MRLFCATTSPEIPDLSDCIHVRPHNCEVIILLLLLHFLLLLLHLLLHFSSYSVSSSSCSVSSPSSCFVFLLLLLVDGNTNESAGKANEWIHPRIS